MQVIKSTKETFAGAMQIVGGVVGKSRQTLPILSNVLIRKSGSHVEFTATDLDLEAHTFAEVGGDAPDVALTVDAAKLSSLVATLDAKEEVTLEVAQNDSPMVEIRQGKSAFKLNTMPADEFPVQAAGPFDQSFTLASDEFRHVLQLVHFAMAQQDIRYYLNGMYLRIEGDKLKAVTTDGHRLAYTEETLKNPVDCSVECIVPRRTVLELIRLMPEDDTPIRIELTQSVFCATFKNVTLISKLVEGKFPDYTRVIPTANNNVFDARREAFLTTLKRVSILTNAKLHSLRWQLRKNALCIQSTNSDREEVTDYVDIAYDGEDIDIGFNILYLQDVLSNLKCENVRFALSNGTGAMLITMPDSASFKYVVMPMRA